MLYLILINVISYYTDLEALHPSNLRTLPSSYTGRVSSRAERKVKDPSLSARLFVDPSMASSQLNFTNLNLTLYAASRRRSSSSRKWGRFHCSSSYRPSSKSYKVTLLPGDGIGPEVISVAKDVLQVAGSLEGQPFWSSPFYCLSARTL